MADKVLAALLQTECENAAKIAKKMSEGKKKDKTAGVEVKNRVWPNIWHLPTFLSQADRSKRRSNWTQFDVASLLGTVAPSGPAVGLVAPAATAQGGMGVAGPGMAHQGQRQPGFVAPQDQPQAAPEGLGWVQPQ